MNELLALKKQFVFTPKQMLRFLHKRAFLHYELALDYQNEYIYYKALKEL